MRPRTFRFAAAAVALLLSGELLLAGRQAALPSVFTAQQATAGRGAYEKSCASCHLPDLSGSNDVPPLSGAVFMSTWRTRTTKDLLDYMSASMPPGGSSLGAEAFEAIAAYILEKNGAAAGAQPLSGATAVVIETLVAS